MTRILTVSSGSATPNTECSACATQGFSGAARIGKRRAREAEQRNAGGTQQKRGPDLNGWAGSLVGGDHEPQHQQRRCNRRGADDGGKGSEQMHLVKNTLTERHFHLDTSGHHTLGGFADFSCHYEASFFLFASKCDQSATAKNSNWTGWRLECCDVPRPVTLQLRGRRRFRDAFGDQLILSGRKLPSEASVSDKS